ncbi:hypothetical protein [Nioella aestuarii]|uniref:hypothetical protein n=1 Tax=Nioella aestuarii TaxID=1662864 RepID=UPI003D7F3EAC
MQGIWAEVAVFLGGPLGVVSGNDGTDSVAGVINISKTRPWTICYLRVRKTRSLTSLIRGCPPKAKINVIPKTLSGVLMSSAMKQLL